MKLLEIIREMGLNEEFATSKDLQDTISYLSGKEKVLLLATSNRFDMHDGDVPKSTLLARIVEKALEGKAELIEVPKLNIYNCEGNVSTKNGNNCGVLKAALQDKEKNPTGELRCWASFNNADDELYKIANPLFESDAVVFFGSIRWGTANAYYQKLIERLTWLENRHTTLQEENLLEGKDAGFIFTGQNWNGAEAVTLQKQVHEFFGFSTPQELYWNWQYTRDEKDETQASYKKSYSVFTKEFKIADKLPTSEIRRRTASGRLGGEI